MRLHVLACFVGHWVEMSMESTDSFFFRILLGIWLSLFHLNILGVLRVEVTLEVLRFSGFLQCAVNPCCSSTCHNILVLLTMTGFHHCTKPVHVSSHFKYIVYVVGPMWWETEVFIVTRVCCTCMEE